MKLSPPPPPPPVTWAEAAHLIGEALRQLQKLIAGGWVADLSLDRVVALCAAPVMRADLGEKQPVLRQAVRRPGGPSDAGIDAGMSLDEVARRCLCWWITDPTHWLAARLVPVTISGFRTTVLAVNGVVGRTATPPVRHRFSGICAGVLPDLTRADSQVLSPALARRDQAPVREMLGARAPAKSGGPTAYLDAH